MECTFYCLFVLKKNECYKQEERLLGWSTVFQSCIAITSIQRERERERERESIRSYNMNRKSGALPCWCLNLRYLTYAVSRTVEFKDTCSKYTCCRLWQILCHIMFKFLTAYTFSPGQRYHTFSTIAPSKVKTSFKLTHGILTLMWLIHNTFQLLPCELGFILIPLGTKLSPMRFFFFCGEGKNSLLYNNGLRITVFVWRHCVL